MLEATRRVLAENRPHARARAALHAEGGGRAARRRGVRPRAARTRGSGYVYDQAGADRRGDPRRAVLAVDGGDASRPRRARRHVRRRRAAPRSQPRRRRSRTCGSGASTRRRPRTSGMIDGGTARQHRPRVLHVPRRGALARRAEARRRRPGDARARVTFAASLDGVRGRDRGAQRATRGYRFRRDDEPVRLAERGARAGRTRADAIALCGRRRDANVFNERGLACVNLANGMAEIHTPDEHIAVADLERDGRRHARARDVAARRDAA